MSIFTSATLGVQQNVALSNEEVLKSADKQRLYILCKNRYSDEQYYMIWFSMFFMGISIWAYINNFKPYDTIGVFMAMSFIILMIALFLNRKRFDTRKRLKDLFATPKPNKADPKYKGIWGNITYLFDFIYWYTVADNPKPWKEIRNLKNLNSSFTDKVVKELYDTIKITRDNDRFCLKAYSIIGILAVLGTIFRLHTIMKESNASGAILIILYQIVFTMYTTWQLLFENITYLKVKCTSANFQSADAIERKAQSIAADTVRKLNNGLTTQPQQATYNTNNSSFGSINPDYLQQGVYNSRYGFQ